MKTSKPASQQHSLPTAALHKRAPVLPAIAEPPQVVSLPIDVAVKEEELCQAFSDALIAVEDIDEGDGDMPQLCSEYVNDIYAYLRSLEV